MDPSILTTAQAAKILGVSVRTAQLWIESGALASWKTPGGHRRVRSVDVYALVHGGPAGSSEPARAHLPSSFQLVSPSDDGLSYPVADNEPLRLAAVDRSGIVDTPQEADFDDLTRLAADVMHVPVALVTLLTPSRQWFKSHHGLPMSETPRSWAFCNYTVLQDAVFQVGDLSADPRFSVNPAVQGEPHFRFYAGAPLLDADGFALGSLCLIDMVPRKLDEAQSKILSVLAAQVSAQIKLRVQERELRRVGCLESSVAPDTNSAR